MFISTILDCRRKGWSF